MATASADKVDMSMASGQEQVIGLETVPRIPRERFPRQISQGQAGVQHVGLLGTVQGRSQSMPMIEKASNNEAKSLLQKRAQAGHGDLRLPSFKSLGIGLPRPEHLLTPPDDADSFGLGPLAVPHNTVSIPGSAPILSTIHMDSINQTTPPQECDSNIPQERTEQSNTPATEPLQAVETTVQPSVEPILARHPSSSSEDDTPRGPAWLEKTLDVVGMSYRSEALVISRQLKLTPKPVTSVSTNGKANPLFTLFQCQPCPISPDAGPTTTAFTPILESLQATLVDGQCIDVTHAVPPQFNMASLPSSPMGTPNPTSGQADYFSMSVFSKAVATLHHSDALRSPVSSSPRPVVPPHTVGVSLLERYIPPSTAEEFLDLFSMEAPSVFVDRLTELSPDGGSLVFIYPTRNGASAFASRYLGPLLDPLLRTMVGIHGLTTDLSHDIGKLAAVDSMFSFEKMVRKIIFLLPRLSRTFVPTASPARKLTLVHSSKQIVNVSRATWTEWWLQQEAPRIKEVVRKYYKRGSRLPERRDITEGGLAREVLDGVKGRSYGPYDRPRDGIEVGVFVIKRTA